jgi:hypothetical protein
MAETDPSTRILLTPCACDLGGTPIVVTYIQIIDLPAGPWPHVYCIYGIDPYVKCWTIELTELPITTSVSYTALAEYRLCSLCMAAGPPLNTLPEPVPPLPVYPPCPDCRSCIHAYFNLLDCCTDEPYKNEDGNILYFEYNGVVSNPTRPTPATFVSPVAITNVYDNTEQLIASGCLVLNEVTYDPDIVYLDWETAFFDATFNDNCEICTRNCQPCYTLVNCQFPMYTLDVITDLSLYLNEVIVIVGPLFPPDTPNCWHVQLAESCTGLTTEVAVLRSYVECCECTGAYKLTDCSNSSNTLLTLVNLSTYINKVITIQGSTVCWRVSIPETCTGTKTNVIVVNTLSDCSKCRGCFLLVNCEDATDFDYVIDPNLTQYANTTVILKFGTKCYKVLYDPFCEGEPATLDVAVSFTDTSTQTGCEQCIPTPKPPKLTNERPVRPGYIKPVCPNNCESGCSDCNSCNNC